MGGWVKKIEYHEHDYPKYSRQEIGVGSEWLCDCGITFSVCSSTWTNHAVHGVRYMLKWGVKM